MKITRRTSNSKKQRTAKEDRQPKKVNHKNNIRISVLRAKNRLTKILLRKIKQDVHDASNDKAKAPTANVGAFFMVQA